MYASAPRNASGCEAKPYFPQLIWVTFDTFVGYECSGH